MVIGHSAVIVEEAVSCNEPAGCCSCWEEAFSMRRGLLGDERNSLVRRISGEGASTSHSSTHCEA